MKRAKMLLALLVITVMFSCTPALAAEISNELPPEAEFSDLSDPDLLLPVDVIPSADGLELRKVYELAPEVDPSQLPYESFERNGLSYICTDILRQVVMGNDSKTLTQTETVESEKKDMDTLLTLLPTEKEVTTEDGFTGVLTLNQDTIKTEASGYGSSSKTVTASRSYPSLSDADVQYVPKTIEEDGRTLTLTDVQWQSQGLSSNDIYGVNELYTALATYSGSKSTSYATGYTVTAEYSGEVSRSGVSMIRYTVVYSGAPIVAVQVEEVTEKESLTAGFNLLWLWLALLLAAVVVLLIVLKKRKEKKNYEENIYYGASTYVDVDHDDDSDGQ